MTKIKVCGLTDVETALAAARAGVDFVGLVFAPSRRHVSEETAQKIAEAVSSLKPRPEIVGVFVNMEADEVNRIARHCHLDIIQLSGDENWSYLKQMKKPVIKVIHISDSSRAGEILAELERNSRLDFEHSVIPLVDTKKEGAYGGTGSSFNWKLAAEVAARFPVMIAGGLDTANVEQMIKDVKPWGVDVSSGVETGSRKDIKKIRTFIDEVRRGCF